MILKFGLEIGEKAFPALDAESIYCDEFSILGILEKIYGIGCPENLDFLRVEQYRQALKQFLVLNKNAFFAKSYEADPLATASTLLYRRDELKLSGFNFEHNDCTEERIAVFIAIEKILNLLPLPFYSGYADRFEDLLKYIESNDYSLIKAIHINESLEIIPVQIQRLFSKLSNRGCKIIENQYEQIQGNTDLNQFKYTLSTTSNKKIEAKADGTIVLMQFSSDSYAAAYLSKVIAGNPDYKPLCILPDKNRSLDNAFIQEGLPSFGILSASLSRPTLQILKLATVFIWNPINPYKLLEFLSLPNIPLNKGLALRLAAAVSEKPGIMSSLWHAKKNDFFKDLDYKIESSKKNEYLLREKKRAEKDYKFWFERKRYDIKHVVPAKEVIEIYDYIRLWAQDILEELNNKIEKIEFSKTKNNLAHKESEILNLQTQQKPFIALQEQCKKLILILETLPENEKMISFLYLERIIRALCLPTQFTFRQSELGHLPYVYHPSAIYENSDSTLWWNFIDNGQNPGFEFWYSSEFEFLKKLNVYPEKIGQKNKRLIWQRKNAILRTNNSLVLIIPDTVEGKSVHPHPLWGDLHATFGKSLKKLIVRPEQQDSTLTDTLFKSPAMAVIDSKKAKNIVAFIHVNNNQNRLKARETETFSGLESLIYYPYQWVFRYVLELYKSSILSVVRPETLKGNLAHSIFEKLLNESKQEHKIWDKESLFKYLEKEIPILIEREANVLMMYGQESERRAFINMMKQAAWSLISAIQQNSWKILGSEQKIEGLLGEQPLKGKADLILERDKERAVIDLKISGTERYKKKIRNSDDIQLLIYSKFAADNDHWAHSAYFIINKAQLLAANNNAFAEAEAVLPEADNNAANDSNWKKLQRTYEWRLKQILEGKIEVRTTQNLNALEEFYRDEDLISIMELPNEPSKYDIYAVLIGSNIY